MSLSIHEWEYDRQNLQHQGRDWEGDSVSDWSTIAEKTFLRERISRDHYSLPCREDHRQLVPNQHFLSPRLLESRCGICDCCHILACWTFLLMVFSILEPMNIALGPIPEPGPEPSLLQASPRDGITILSKISFYMDDIFHGVRTYEKGFILSAKSDNPDQYLR